MAASPFRRVRSLSPWKTNNQLRSYRKLSTSSQQFVLQIHWNCEILWYESMTSLITPKMSVFVLCLQKLSEKPLALHHSQYKATDKQGLGVSICETSDAGDKKAKNFVVCALVGQFVVWLRNLVSPNVFSVAFWATLKNFAPLKSCSLSSSLIKFKETKHLWIRKTVSENIASTANFSISRSLNPLLLILV